MQLRSHSKRKNEFPSTQPQKKHKSAWSELEEKANFTYQESAYNLDKPQYIFVETVKLLNDNKGYGLYAAIDIPKGTILGEYTGERGNKLNVASDYTMEISSNLFCDSEKKGNFIRFINFSAHQDNMEFAKINQNGNDICILRAIKPVKAGQQLLVDYNMPSEEQESYYFLDVDDSWKSASDYVKDEKYSYQTVTITEEYPAFNLRKGDVIYTTKLGVAILNNEELDLNPQEHTDPNYFNLRFFKQDTIKKIPMEFNELDSFDALMLASYLGQVKNVNYLLQAGVYLNRQQTISGCNALFFAVLGKKDHPNSTAYLQIILSLIEHGADIFIQNKKNDLFILPAIKYFKFDEFSKMLSFIISHDENNLKMVECINQNDENIIMSAIKNKKVKHLEKLFEYYPNYLQSNVALTNAANTNCFYDTSDLRKFVFSRENKSYSLTKLQSLKSLLLKNLPWEVASELYSEPDKLLKNQPLKLFDVRQTKIDGQKNTNPEEKQNPLIQRYS